MNLHFIPLVQRRSRFGMVYRWMSEGALVVALLLLPNLLLGIYFATTLNLERAPHPFDQRPIQGGDAPFYWYLFWLCANLAVIGMLVVVRRRVVLPLHRIAQHLHQLRDAYNHETGHAGASSFNIARLAVEVGRFAAFALDHYRKHQELAIELQQARQAIGRFAEMQHAILNSTNREIAQQYRCVLAYAHYLEERIAGNRLDPALRYDFDDTCESGFNLKLIAGALTMLGTSLPETLANVPLAPLMQRTLLALAPALDRRAMKLTSIEVDMAVAARGDAEIITQILWMMLLGMIRYAADESTLRIRCLHSRDGRQALLSIVVSELSPNCMSEDERSDYLARRLHHLTPHMFAETIRIHGNVQLAHLLLTRIHGHISVLPLTVSSCEICMVLPSAEVS